MADQTANQNSVSRFRQLLDRIEEYEGEGRPGAAMPTVVAEPTRVPVVEPAVGARPAPAHAAVRAEAAPSAPGVRSVPSRGRSFWEAFKIVAILFSFVVNIGLVIVVLILGMNLFRIKQAIAEPLVGGLHAGFVEMDQSTIRRTILVRDTLPVGFDLPVQQETVVVLTQNVPLTNIPTTMSLGPFGQINGSVNLVLPRGTRLPIQLDLVIPVATDVPVNLDVEAVIPLNETELHQPFERFRNLFEPYNLLLAGLPNSYGEAVNEFTSRFR